ncbi:MAG: hypothetical protein LBQ09_07225, partial [Acidobacteriaceae bacterium]|nr:hypothetical protein [Acidobacteriaceae bacterium]
MQLAVLVSGKRVGDKAKPLRSRAAYECTEHLREPVQVARRIINVSLHYLDKMAHTPDPRWSIRPIDERTFSRRA